MQANQEKLKKAKGHLNVAKENNIIAKKIPLSFKVAVCLGFNGLVAWCLWTASLPLALTISLQVAGVVLTGITALAWSLRFHENRTSEELRIAQLKVDFSKESNSKDIPQKPKQKECAENNNKTPYERSKKPVLNFLIHK